MATTPTSEQTTATMVITWNFDQRSSADAASVNTVSNLQQYCYRYARLSAASISNVAFPLGMATRAQAGML